MRLNLDIADILQIVALKFLKSSATDANYSSIVRCENIYQAKLRRVVFRNYCRKECRNNISTSNIKQLLYKLMLHQGVINRSLLAPSRP